MSLTQNWLRYLIYSKPPQHQTLIFCFFLFRLTSFEFQKRPVITEFNQKLKSALEAKVDQQSYFCIETHFFSKIFQLPENNSERARMGWTGLEFIYMPASPPCRAVWMCIKELGLEVDMRQIDMYKKAEHTQSWFVKVSTRLRPSTDTHTHTICSFLFCRHGNFNFSEISETFYSFILMRLRNQW